LFALADNFQNISFTSAKFSKKLSFFL
jgi:hypothetical protein